jgi:hypothetical protein
MQVSNARTSRNRPAFLVVSGALKGAGTASVHSRETPPCRQEQAPFRRAFHAMIAMKTQRYLCNFCRSELTSFAVIGCALLPHALRM